MTIQEQIETLAKKQRQRIGVGYLRDVPEVIDSLKKAQEYADIITIGKTLDGFGNITADENNLEAKLIESYKDKKVGGVLRGHGDAYKLRDIICRELSYQASDLIECSLFRSLVGHTFIIGPVSQAQGWTKNQKIAAIQGLAAMLTNFGVKPKVGLLTAVRTGSRGRNFFLDQTYEIADDCVEWCGQNGIVAKNYNIELETALEEQCNIIIPPNGVAGNQMLRALTFIAGQPAFCHPVPGMKDPILENMRNETNWLNSIKYLVAQINSKLK